MLACLQDQPVELAIPCLVGGSLEPLKQLEASVAETLQDVFGGFDGPAGVPGRVGVVQLGSRK